MKLAGVVISAPTDEEAKVLDGCLKSLSRACDKIFLTITGENKAVEKVGRKYKAVISHCAWENDFSKARNFALSQVPDEYDYWMWADADDEIRGIENLRSTIEKNADVDAFVFNYLYAFDEWKNPVIVHMKTRVLRNDGCVEWRGALHEDFHNTRELNAKFVEGIEWLHMSDLTRADASRKRNVTVAENDVVERPEDPRSYWNLGNALKADGQNEASIDAFTKFLSMSKSEDEKYIVFLRLSEIYSDTGDHVKALECTRTSIGLRPRFPDAYIASARILMLLGRFPDARDALMMALQLEPPYHEIIVYNPRDYDLVPLKMLAEVYFKMSLPQLSLECLKACKQITPKDENLASLILKIEVEAKQAQEIVDIVARLQDVDEMTLIAELEKINPEYRSHPMLCTLRNTRIIKKTSSGKDVVFYCGYTEEIWTPETAKEKGIGGSEEAVIHLSKRLADRGYNVIVYNNCGHKRLSFDGVEYRPFWEWNYRDKQDVVVIWRAPRALDYEINAEKVFLDMHDVVPDGEFTKNRVEKATKVFFKSQSHRKLYPAIPDEKCVIVPNGIVWEQFQSDVVKEPGLIINTSSPDRSLKTLLNAFKRVREAVPTARLQWAYGWNVWDSVFSGDPERLAWKEEVIKMAEETEGVEILGRLGHDEVAKLYQRASIFAYPTAFYEIDCISARKAQAGGAWPIVTDFAALDETVQHGFKVVTDPGKENWGKNYQFDFGIQDERAVDEWVDACIYALQNPPDEERVSRMREWTKQFDWESIADKWVEVIK